MKGSCKILVLLLFFSLLVIQSCSHCPDVYIVGDSEDNLFVCLLKQQGIKPIMSNSMGEVEERAGEGDCVFVLADDYPNSFTSVLEEDYIWADSVGVRMFVEYPGVMPGGDISSIYKADCERGVVLGEEIGLKPMSIVGINGCRVIDCSVSDPLMLLAKIAGYDTAVFGLEGVSNSWPLLFESGNSLIAGTSFSNCVKGRYGPVDSWEKIISYSISKTIGRNVNISLPVEVSPSYGKGEKLPRNAELESAHKAVQWLWNARLFIDDSWRDELFAKYQPVGGDPNRFFGEPITDKMKQGDGSEGIMEGHASIIDEKGDQEYRYFIRADVQGESSFLLAVGSDITDEPQYSITAEKLLDYLFYSSGFRGEERGDLSSDVYGLISWSNTHLGAFFNDDNARCILGAIGASSLMNKQRWNSFITDNIMANFRLSSSEGFIGSCLWQQDIVSNGWKWYADRKNYVNPSPHFESWMWALYLWLYDKTAYEPLYERAKSAISYMMDIYPDWISQNGIQQERARMILPLAWLVRVDDTPEHRKWLDIVVSKFLEYQDECGAIREELGSAESDHNKLLISSNDEYGKNEASLIAQNGDPVADMLYTCNFGFFALNEAARATGDKRYAQAVDKLADFLVRIQAKSDTHKDLDGAWFRAFDYGRWDYWASNADNGWGAWCTLCGWIETWIGVTEYLVGKDTSYWDITETMQMEEAFHQSMEILY